MKLHVTGSPLLVLFRRHGVFQHQEDDVTTTVPAENPDKPANSGLGTPCGRGAAGCALGGIMMETRGHVGKTEQAACGWRARASPRAQAGAGLHRLERRPRKAKSKLQAAARSPEESWPGEHSPRRPTPT